MPKMGYSINANSRRVSSSSGSIYAYITTRCPSSSMVHRLEQFRSDKSFPVRTETKEGK